MFLSLANFLLASPSSFLCLASSPSLLSSLLHSTNSSPGPPRREGKAIRKEGQGEGGRGLRHRSEGGRRGKVGQQDSQGGKMGSVDEGRGREARWEEGRRLMRGGYLSRTGWDRMRVKMEGQSRDGSLSKADNLRRDIVCSEYLSGEAHCDVGGCWSESFFNESSLQHLHVQDQNFALLAARRVLFIRLIRG